MSITFVYGSTQSTGDYRNTRGQGTIAQEQYTPMVSEPATVKQTQSVRITPEVHLLSREDVAYVDSIANKYVSRVETYIISKNEEIKEAKKQEAKAYLAFIGATLILSGIGLWIGGRLETNSIIYLSISMLSITLYFIFLKIPTLITLLF